MLFSPTAKLRHQVLVNSTYASTTRRSAAARARPAASTSAAVLQMTTSAPAAVPSRDATLRTRGNRPPARATERAAPAGSTPRSGKLSGGRSSARLALSFRYAIVAGSFTCASGGASRWRRAYVIPILRPRRTWSATSSRMCSAFRNPIISAGSRNPQSRSSSRPAGMMPASWQMIGSEPLSISGTTELRSRQVGAFGNQSSESSAGRWTMTESAGHNSVNVTACVSMGLGGCGPEIGRSCDHLEQSPGQLVRHGVEARGGFRTAGRGRVGVQQDRLAIMEHEIEFTVVEPETPARFPNRFRHLGDELFLDRVASLDHRLAGPAERHRFPRAEEHPGSQAVQLVASFGQELLDHEVGVPPDRSRDLLKGLVDRICLSQPNAPPERQQPVCYARGQPVQPFGPPSVFAIGDAEAIAVGLDDHRTAVVGNASDQLRADAGLRDIPDPTVDHSRIVLPDLIVAGGAVGRVDVNDGRVGVHAARGIVQDNQLDPGGTPAGAEEREEVMTGELVATADVNGDPAHGGLWHRRYRALR